MNATTQSDLQSRLNQSVNVPKSSEEYHKKLVDVTQKVVSQTFFGTLLKQMRDSPFKSDLFTGGRGGAAFGSLYDQHLAEHMSRGTGSKLVNALVKRFEGNKAYSSKKLPQQSNSRAR